MEAAAVTTTTTAAPPPAAAAQPTAQPREGALTGTAFHELPLERQAAYAQVKRADGNGSEWVERSKLPADPGDGTTTTAPNIAVNGNVVRVGDLELSETELRDLILHKSTQDSRKGQLPATAAEYKLTLPKEFQIPQGVEFAFKETDPVSGPLLAQAKAFALEHNIPQDGFSKMLSIKQMLVTSRHVGAFEKLISKFTSQGAATFMNHGREPPQRAGRVSDAEYAALSSGDKIAYARQYPQQQFNSAGLDDVRR